MLHRTTQNHHKERFLALSQFLKELRFAEGRTQQEIGESFNLHRNTILRAESAKNLTLFTIFELADAYNIPISELFEGIE